MKYLVSIVLLVLGRYRRNRGWYNKNTLALFHRAYKLNPNSLVLLHYIRFRRDMGNLLRRRLALQLLSVFHKLRGKQCRQAANLLIESGFEKQLRSSIDITALSPFVLQSPPIASLVSSDIRPVGYSEVLSELYRNQSVWRREFRHYLLQRNHSICVVGNSGSIIGSQNGNTIDQYDVVVRFNCYSSAFSNAEDVGNKITVWSCAPNCTELFIERFALEYAEPEWNILSGPDVHYQMMNWQAVAQFINKKNKLLTVPLTVWNSLVRLLYAPPSAGLLLLSWIIDMRGNAKDLVVTGFDIDATTKRYHQALPGHKAVTRHNWEGEKKILQKWKVQGLVVLESDGFIRKNTHESITYL